MQQNTKRSTNARITVYDCVQHLDSPLCVVLSGSLLSDLDAVNVLQSEPPMSLASQQLSVLSLPVRGTRKPDKQIKNTVTSGQERCLVPSTWVQVRSNVRRKTH